MYKDGEAALDRILTLVAKCPRELQEKCFEVLLRGYVQLEVGTPPHAGTGAPAAAEPTAPLASPSHAETSIPPSVLPRFKNMAKRLGIELEKLEAIFDFNVDPFGIHAVAVPGKNNAEKTRGVALLAATRSYLATGAWTADRQEIKAMCVDQNCYDLSNYSVTLKKGEGSLFKNVDPGKAIELSSAGIKEAERLLKILSGAPGDSE